MKGMYKLFLLILLAFSCSGEQGVNGDGNEPPTEIIPSNLVVNIEVDGADDNNPNGNGTGLVKFTASANDAINYSFRFGTGESQESSSGSVEYTYTDVGTKTYNINVLAYSSTGNFISLGKTVTVYVVPVSDEDILAILTGGDQKTWKVNASYDSHFSLGSKDHKYPSWWEAPSFSKSNSGFYDDEYIFKSDGTYSHKTNGDVYGKAKYLNQTFGSTGQAANSDGEIEKFNLSNYEGSFYVKNEDDQRKIIFNNKSFVGFYVGQHEYTLECNSENSILLRSVDTDNNAWYIWLTDNDVSTTPSKDMFTNLIWSDEFDYSGKLDSNKWAYEVRNQWYNEELQATTDRLENVRVDNGLLKITAKKENYGGKNYTSGRVRTYQKLDFTYGRVDIRAKVPSKAGTWPALWMLGSNYASLDWPKCGEIDILEHAGNRLNQIQSTVHHPDNYGSGDSNVTHEYNDVSTNFHVYSLVWTEKALTFYVDDKPFHIVGNACDLPFNWDFNIIVNVAMGGTYGGTVDPNFDFDTMEVDYVRVYQK